MSQNLRWHNATAGCTSPGPDKKKRNFAENLQTFWWKVSVEEAYLCPSQKTLSPFLSWLATLYLSHCWLFSQWISHIWCCGDGAGSSEFSFESGSFLLAPWQGGENSLKSNSEVGEMFLWRRTVSYQSDQSKSISPLSGERVARYSRSLCSSCSSQIPLGNSSCWRLRKFHVLATSTRNLDYVSLKWQEFFIIKQVQFKIFFAVLQFWVHRLWPIYSWLNMRDWLILVIIARGKIKRQMLADPFLNPHRFCQDIWKSSGFPANKDPSPLSPCRVVITSVSCVHFIFFLLFLFCI